MQTDYPELSGKLVSFVVEENSVYTEKKTIGEVVYVNYDMGITIVDALDKKHKILCLNRKDCKAKWYPMAFYAILNQIKAGKVRGLEIQEMLDSLERADGPYLPCMWMQECAFDS